MKKLQHDKLHRPLPDKDSGELPLASDMLVASAARRFAAFIWDSAIIASILSLLITLMVGDSADQPAYVEQSYFFRALMMMLFFVWGGYVVLFNASSLKATPGQMLMRIYVCTIFGERITLAVACVRFMIFAAPTLSFLAYYMEEVISVFPIWEWQTQHIVIEDEFYPAFLAAILVQFLLIWPWINGNITRVWWDDIVHSCVLKRDPRIDS